MATRRISVDIDEDEHKYLKMCCAKLGVTVEEFATQAVIQRVEEYEDELDLEAIRKAKEENEDASPWEEAKKQIRAKWDE